MNKKGFTLVELLAVIVILAIIALITVPIVLKTISNSEVQAEKQSIEGYARVIEDDKANEEMTHPGQQYQIKPEEEYEYKGNRVFCQERYFDSDNHDKLVLKNCYVSETKLSDEEEAKKNHYNYINGKVEKITNNSNNNQESSENNTQSTSKTAVSTLLVKSNDVSATYTSGTETSHQMYAFEHPETAQTPALTDYRYIGNDPYNYVDFNGETWRIIGIFTVEDENGNTSQRIKIIKDEKLSSNMAWGFSNVNEWPTASLNTYLNGDYYNGLSNEAKAMISPVKTYLGGGRYDSNTHYGTAEDMYAWERGTDRYDSSRSLNDTKNISLIYPSDYTYTYGKGIDNTCYNDGFQCDSGNPSLGWLYKSSYTWWIVSPIADYYHLAFYVYNAGYVNYNRASRTYGVRPVTYLISDISFEGNHTGSATDHYVLKK